jgi:hypothetical protein
MPQPSGCLALALCHHNLFARRRPLPNDKFLERDRRIEDARRIGVSNRIRLAARIPLLSGRIAGFD